MSSEPTHYETLGVKFPCSGVDLTIAYRRMAMKWHPDRHQDSTKQEAEAVFKKVQAAYAVLSNEQAKKAYDQSLRQHETPNPKATQYSHFHRASGNNAREEGKPRAGPDVVVEASISVENAVRGCDYRFTLPPGNSCTNCFGHGGNRQRCTACHGSGRKGEGVCGECSGVGARLIACDMCGGKGQIDSRTQMTVRIPPGVIDGSKVRAKGRGQPGRNGETPGDLLLVIKIRMDNGWKCFGSDLHGVTEISFASALLGGIININVPTGSLLQITIPPGTDSFKSIRLANMGLFDASRKTRGDILLKCRIGLPRHLPKLTQAEEEFLRRVCNLSREN